MLDITERRRKEEALLDAKEFLSILLENTPIPILLINPDKSIRFVNPALEKATGFSSGELIGRKPPYPWWAEEAMEESSKNFEQAFYNGSEGIEKLFKKKTGRRFWVKSFFKPVRENGAVKYCLITWIDITERKNAEEDLKESEQRYRNVVDNIGIGLAIISPNMEILSINNEIKRWFPTIDETQKPICYRYFNCPPRESICPYCPIIKTLSDGKIHEALTETPAGSKIINYRITSSPIKNKDGNIIAVIKIVEDVTARKRLRQVLKDTEKKYQTLYESSRDAIILLSPEEGFFGGNLAAIEMFGFTNEEELRSYHTLESLSPEYQSDGTLSSIKAQQNIAIALEKGSLFFAWKHKRLNGAEFFSTVLLTRIDLNGKSILQVTIRDVSSQKWAEEELIERQKQLEAKKDHLEQINTALNILLKKRGEDKREVEEKVLLNIKELVEPYLEKLKKSRMDESQNAYLNILESNLKNVTSPFSYTLFSRFLYFTPTEIEITNLIREGKKTKEIASLLNLASLTIEFHRKNIRKKLEIDNKKINLTTYLKNLQK